MGDRPSDTATQRSPAIMSKRQSPTASGGSAKRSRSLSAQIAALVDPTPRDRDDAVDDAHAEFTQVDDQVDYGDEDGEDVHSRMAPSGRLRMQAGIDDDDEKYAGRVAQLSDASSDDESDDAQPIGRDEGDEEESEEESDQESDDDEESDEDDVSGELEDEDGDSGAMFQRELEQLQQEEQQVLAGISRVNHDEVERAGAVREQTKMWTDLLELRIAVQGCLTNANRMPKVDTFESFASDPLVSQKLEEAQQLAMDTVNDLQKLTANISTASQDEDDEPLECENVDDLWTDISGRLDAARSWQGEQISWWGRKTMAARQLQGGKAFQSLAKDAMEQVKEVMSDMPRLLKRTHLKRSEYKILGDVPTPNDAEEQRDSHLNQHDTEVFDDTDFYERLLQELIDTGSQASLQAAITGRTEVKKSKHQVDTRASKGRKIRYHVHQKLANFMYATGFQMPPVTEELFSRLFGQQKQQEN